MITKLISGISKQNRFYSALRSYNFSSGHSCNSNSCKSNPPELNNAPEPFETLRKDVFTQLYATGSDKRIPGYATPEGTKKYSARKQGIFSMRNEDLICIQLEKITSGLHIEMIYRFRA